MAAVDILVPSPLSSFNAAAYSNDAALFRMIYSEPSSTTSAAVDDGYSSPDDTSLVISTTGNSTPPLVPQQEEDVESIKERVMKQVEWYFSDENLQKDSFLMKHITRNKQGYVSLKLVASLRKIKSITKDWKLVLAAVQNSTQLQVNEEETKIRRKEAAPKVDYSRLPRTLLVTNYPINNPTEADVKNEFSHYGNVTNITLLHPGRAIPLDVKSCRSKFPAIGKEFCILVEYSSARDAKKTLKELSQNWRQTMIIKLLSNAETESTTTKTIISKPAAPSLESRNNVTKTPPVRKTIIRHKTPMSGYDSGYTRSPSLSPMPSPAPSRKFFSSSEPSSPPAHSRLSLIRSTNTAVPVMVIRLPHGPDGSAGFHH